jgi:hypothetical protein
MSQQTTDGLGKKPDIDIDYEHLDVARVMAQIKGRVAGEVSKEAEGSVPQGSPQAYGSGPGSEGFPAVRHGRARRLLLKLMSPFRPLIKLLILPVYDEFQQTVFILDNANRRLDRLTVVTDRDREIVAVRLERLKEYTKLLHGLSHNLVVELTKLKIENDTLKAKLQVLEKDFDFLGKREHALEHEVFK